MDVGNVSITRNCDQSLEGVFCGESSVYTLLTEEGNFNLTCIFVSLFHI